MDPRALFHVGVWPGRALFSPNELHRRWTVSFHGCSFCHTTYHALDYTQPTWEFGVPLHHPQFLEWIGTPESASLLDMGPERWLHSLTRDAASQLHRDVCLMTSNLDILDQYVLGLQGTASKILDITLGSREFASAAVAAAARDPRARQAAVHM